MFSGAALRRLVTSRIAYAILGALLAAGAMLWLWRPWAARGPVGRVVLAEPVETYDPDYVYTLPTPAAPDWQRSGKVVECPVIEPATRDARRELELFGDESLGDLLYIDPDVGELPYGGSLRVRRPEVYPDAETPPLVEVDLVASRAPLARWDELHLLEAQIGVATPLQGIHAGEPDPYAGLRYRPGEGHLRRRWSVAPEIAGRYRRDAGAEVDVALSFGYCGGSDCR